jgi:hypothetical protein
MLAALNLAAVGLGVGAGGLSATVAAFAFSLLLTFAGADTPDLGLLVGIIIGFAVGGWVAGRLAPNSERFHGAVSGLLLAGLYIVVASLGGGNVATGSVLGIALMAVVVAGGAGWLAGRRKQSAP